MKSFEDMRILIVDDDPLFLELINAILSSKGYRNISMMPSAESAREHMELELPDLLLLDVVLPGMNGYELCAQLRADDRTAQLPIIMITGGAGNPHEVLKKTFTAGTTDFIRKPLEAVELEVRVRAALKLKQTYDRMQEALTLCKEVELQQRKLVGELQQALRDVKQLSGLLPICSACKKIRDDKGYWQQIESYISRHSDTEFMHGMCPECLKEYYPELEDYEDE